MGIFKRIKGGELHKEIIPKGTKPIVLEKLEPRIMLSVDGLLNVAPASLEDTLLENTSQVIQHVELMDTNAQVEEQVSQELASSDTLNSDICKPILTLSQDDTNDEKNEPELVVDIASPTQVDGELDLQLADSDNGIALVLGVDLYEEDDVEPISENVDAECFESCQRQLIIEQLTETLRVPHGPPGAEGLLASLDNIQLEYIDAGGQIDLIIRLNTQNSTVIEIFDNNKGELLANYALSEINSLTVIGSDNSDDTLTVDFSNPFSIPGGLIFAGGNGGYDKLVLIGNSELSAEYFGDGDDDGTVIVSEEEGVATNVSYSGLEPFVYLNEFGSVKNSGIFNYGNSPEILEVDAFSQSSGDTLIIEIGGLAPGPGVVNPADPDYNNGYDQINVTGDVLLGGTLEVVLINDFAPSEGDTFDFITFTGNLLDGDDSGTDPDEFDDITGLFGFGDGSLCFEVVVQSDRIQLIVKKAEVLDVVVTAVDADMVAIIDNYLENNETGSSVTVTEANLGGFLDLFTLTTLDFSNIEYSEIDGSYVSGVVYITTQTGKLFPGQSTYADISGVVGSYNPGNGQFGFTLEIFGLNIPGVLTANAENVTIEYDTAGASDQTLVEIDNFTMVLHVLDDTTVQVDNLIIRQDGFSVENASVSLDAVTWLNTIELSDFDLTFTDFNFSTSGPTLAGTIGVSADSIKLFPSQDFFTTEITNFSGAYDLGTSALSLSAENLKIAFSDVLLLELGTTSFSMDAGAGTFSASVASGTLSSPRFDDLPSISVTNLVINQDGFSFDEATLGSINFEIGSVLTIVDFRIVVADFNYSTTFGLESGDVVFAFTSVGIFPGQSLFTANIDNFSGSYDIVNKALNISADSVIIQISDLLEVTATDVDININPFSMSFGSIEVTSPRFPDISGELTEFEITETGFSLGSATLSYGGDISIGPLTVNGLAIGIANYAYSSETTEPFSGSILVYSGGASLVMGGSFSTVISDTDDDDIAVSATLNFEAGVFKDLQFVVDKLEVNIGTFLTFTTTGVDIDTGAENEDFVISFSSISASVKVGGLSLTGIARNFGVTANGNLAVIPGETFGVMIEIGGADGSAFKWPSWLPIKINAIGLELDFEDLKENPLDFTFILSASVSGLPAVAGLEFSGVIEGLRINPGLLLEGKFPVVDIASIGVSVSGELFGGEINGALIGGILKIAETPSGGYEIIDPMDTVTEVHDRVLFMGVQGGFSMPGIGGLTIRFALSELGPLGVFINVEVPGGIVLEPITGLAVNDFAAGVEFFKSLPSIDDPLKLRDPAFSVTSTVSADTWLAGVKEQVFDQYVAIKNNPNIPGFLAAFTSPMLIKGSAKVYTIYTSQEVFNGQVDLILSTDGKFLISGKLNFAADNISISGKLYADLSNVSDGDVTVLFLADIPDQVRLLSIDGKLKMGFRDESGQEVEIPVVISEPVDTNTETSGDLAFPGNGEMIDAGVINSNLSNGSYYIDVKFRPGANRTLDYSTILDDNAEILVELTKVDGAVVTVDVDAIPLPIETNIIDGIAEDTILTAGTQDELISLLESHCVQRFRYLVTDSGFTWDSGVVDVTFVAGSWNQSDGSTNIEEIETFTILGPTVDISNPSNGGRIEISEFDDRMYLDLTFVPTRTAGAIVEDVPLDTPILSGPGLGSISILGPPTSMEAAATFPEGSMTLRYELSGQFNTGEVTITFDSNTFHDSSNFWNTTQILSFIVDGATADLCNPGNDDSIGINVLGALGYIDVVFNSAWDFDIDPGTLNDYAPEIDVTLSDGTKLSIADDPTGSYELDGKTVYSYEFTGTLVPGTATVIFLDDSFADTSGLGNIEEVETFFIEQPTVTFSNLADGSTYLSTSFNELEYFELTLIPTKGEDIDEESTLEFDDLQITGLSGISIYNYERVQIEDETGNLVDTNRFRFFFSGTFPDQPPTDVTFSMAEGAWKDTAGNESGEMSITITVRKPAATFYIELEGGVTLNAADLLNEPIFDVRGYVYFEAKTIDPAFTGELDFYGDTITRNSGDWIADGFRVGQNITVSAAEENGSEPINAGTYEIIELTPTMITVAETLSDDGNATVHVSGPQSYRFELEFGGTFKVIYFGNIASVAGKFVLEIPEKLILDFNQYEEPADDPAKDSDAVTAGDFLEELIGITLEEDDLLHWIQLPKLWGVIKLETNFEKLKEVGIDLKAEALLQINTTQSAKTEIITLEGIPGDVFAELGKNDLSPPDQAEFDGMIDALNSDTLPDELKGLFVGDNVLHDGQYKVETVIGGVLWKVIDEYPDPEDPGPDPQMIKKQYFIQLQDVSDVNSETATSEMKFLLRGETQVFTLQPKMLRVMAYGQAIFRLPAYINQETNEMGPEWFRMTGAFSLKLSVNSLEFFQNGQLTLSPAGYKVLDVRSMAVLIIESAPDIGLAGKIKLGANIELPGVLLSGNMEAFVNTFGEDKTFEVPGFLQEVVGFDSVTIYGASPMLNPDYDPSDADSPVLIPNDDPNAEGSPYLTVAARADLELLDAIVLKGAFRISATTEIVEVCASITTSITVPGLEDPLFDFDGSAAFALDGDGLYGRVDLQLDAGLPSTQLTPGFELEAEYLLEFNTALVPKEIQTYEFNKTDGIKGLEPVPVTLPAFTLHLIAGGTLTFETTTDSTAFELAGRFEFLFSPTMLEIQAEVSVSGGTLLNASAAGALQLSSERLAGFIRISAAAGVGDPGYGDTISGTGFELAFNLALYINTGDEITLNGVTLAANEVKLEASGYLQFSIEDVVGFRIEGSLLVQANNSEGFTVQVHGILLAEIFGVNIVRMNVDGSLAITEVSPGSYEYVIAGRLDLTAGAGAILDGNGFAFDAAMSLEVNTTNNAVDLNDDGEYDLEAGIYVRIHADGDLSFQVGGDTGFKLDGLFDLEVGINGLMVAAEADFLAQVAGQTILKLHADGALLINNMGIAAHIELSFGADPGGVDFSFHGAFIFELNTTSEYIAQIGGVDVDLAAGPYIRLSVTDDDGGSAYLQLSIGGSSSNCFRLEGGLTIEANSSGLQIAANGALKAIISGNTLFSVDAEGALLIDQSGIAAKISLNASAGISGTGFAFSGSFTLEVNTTNHFISSIAGQQVNLAVGPYIRIVVSGELNLLELVSIQGNFILDIQTSPSFALRLDIDGSLRIFSMSFDVEADVLINQDGFALSTGISLSGATKFIPFNGFEISGTFTLEINTTNQAVPDLGLEAGRYVRVTVSGGLNILGFKVSGSFIIEAGSNGFRLEIPESDPINFNFLGIFNIDIYGWVSNQGFRFTGSASIDIGSTFYLHGSATLTLGHDIFSFKADAVAGIKIGPYTTPAVKVWGVTIIPAFTIGPWTIEVGVHAEVTITNNRLTIYAEASAFGFTVGHTFYLGTLDPPGAAQVPPEPILATKLSNGTLRLNIGTYAGERVAAGFNTDVAESFLVTHKSGTATSETVIVESFGFKQEYAGINHILVSNAGQGDDTVRIETGVLVSAELNGGVGNDTLIYLGSGTATLTGGDGNDVMTGGSGNDTLIGSSGNDVMTGGSGNDTLNGCSGDDTILADDGNDIINGGTGFDDIDGGSGNDTIDGGVGIDTIYGHDGNDTITGGSGNDYIEGNDGSDTIYGGEDNDILFGDNGLLDFEYNGDTDPTTLDLVRSATDGLGSGDIIYGNAGSDIILGGTGGDEIYGGDDSDILIGDNADIFMSGFVPGSFTILGSAVNEIISTDTEESTGGADTITGNEAGDIIIGGVNGSSDTLYGNDGDDVILGDNGLLDFAYNGDADLTTLDLICSATDGLGGGDIIYGNAGSDVILGGSGNDDIYGGTGSDTIYGDSGNDLIYGNEDDDEIHGGSGDDNIYGDTGDDTIYGDGDNDVIEGNDGNDIIIGNAGTDTIYGHAGNDILIGDDGSVGSSSVTASDSGSTDYIYGNDGEDKILGGGGDDYLYGFDEDANDSGQQRDIIIGDGGMITYEGDKFDFDDVTMVEADTSSGGNDTIQGNEGDDVILAGAGGDEDVQGNTGNDIMLGDNGTITLSGGLLSDVSTKNESTGGADRLWGDGGNDIIIGGPDGDEIYGEDGSDILIGDNGAVTGTTVESTVEGTDGEDDIYGQEGEDKILGGGNNDELYGDKQPDGALEVDSGNDIIIGDGGTISYSVSRFEFEDVTNITNANQSGGGADAIEGNTGDDIILGGAAGDSDIQGDSGDDTILGDNGTIVLDNASLVYVDTQDEVFGGSDTIHGDIGNDIIIGGLNSSSDTLYGSAGDDIILGDNGFIDFSIDGDLSTLDLIRSATDGLGGGDYIYGNAGSDAILGGTGGDDIQGDAESDILIGDNADIFMSGLVPGCLTILGSTVNEIISTDIGESTGGADTITGNEASDIIIGGVNGSSDTLYGNDGDDVILGDNGLLDFAYNGDTDLTTLDLMCSFTDGLGGSDVIYGNAGEDVLIGGTAGDIIYGDDVNASAGISDGEDILIGDNGQIVLSAETSTEGRLKILDNNVRKINTTDTSEDTGGVDTIEGNAHSDVILGGVKGDTVYGDHNDPTVETIANDDNDVILGDNGELDFNTGDGDLSTLDKVASNLDELGGIDTLSGNAGSDVVIGGTSGDIIYGDDAVASAVDSDGQDILLGDNAQINLEGIDGELYILDSAVKTIRTTDDDQNTGGEDRISGNAAGDFIAGGVMGDDIYSDREEPNTETTAIDGNDYILGDNGRFEWDYHGDPSFADIESGMVFDESLNTLDLVTTELPIEQPGGRDKIFGDDGSDIIFGGTNSDEIYGDDGDETGTTTNNDLIFGDHGRLYPQDSSLPDFNSENFFAIDTGDADGGEGDRVYGEEGDDIILGQQGDDRMFGGSGNDDMIGGHNVIGGIDELSEPDITAEVNPEINDIMDGGTGDDVLAGDNAIIWRTATPSNPRFRVLNGTLMYKMYEEYEDYMSDYGKPDVTNQAQDDPNGTVGRTIELLDHDSELEDKDETTPREFGNDYIAGNEDNDILLGQLGDDVLQGDGSISHTEDEDAVLSYEITVTDSGTPDTSEILFMSVDESLTDGDDYIEGNGGSDLIYGNLGQDDIIGGSSSLFGLITSEQRPDIGDILFGGTAQRVLRNEVLTDSNCGDINILERHSRDSDVLVGDNANVYRIVGTNGQNSGDYLEFNYDVTSERFGDERDGRKIVPRAVELLDYIPGIGDVEDENGDGIVDENDSGISHGQADVIHGESGDDFIHGMIGDDILYGDSEDDDIYGEAGNDWISGGTGDDGILGDDGLIFTSRNTQKNNQKDIALSEPLYGIEKLDNVDLYIDTPGDIQQSVINVCEMLRKSVDLTPFELGGDDIIYGGLGNDSLHGGAGDDAISGAEALEQSAAVLFPDDDIPDSQREDGVVVTINYYNPINPGNILGFEAYRSCEFALYDEYDPLRKILIDEAGDLVKPDQAPTGSIYDFILNFEANIFENWGNNEEIPIWDNDVIFGDLGNDWLVGGIGQDHLYGGYGCDLMNIDDFLDTNEGANDIYDEPEYTGINLPMMDIDPDLTRGADTAYGGAGRDILINNSDADRLIDWVGEFNSYIVPYATFGQFSVSRSLQPQLREYLYLLSESDGSDQSRSFDTGTEQDRHGEPEGELGLVLQKDPDWKEQTGAPDDPQVGNIPGGKRDVMEAEDFDTGSLGLFAIETGSWLLTKGQYQAVPLKESDAISLFYINDSLPNYYEVLATVNANKDKAGYKSNGYIIFDYFSETDFKFAGIDVGTDKLQIGQRTADGWIILTQSNMQLRDGTNYNLMIAVNGTNVTLIVDNQNSLNYTFEPRVIDGFNYGLNYGNICIGSLGSITRFDNVSVRKLPPAFNYENQEDFSDPSTLDLNALAGYWSVNGDRYLGSGTEFDPAIATLVGTQNTSSYIEFETTFNTTLLGGIVFDYYSTSDFKFAAINPETGQIVIGHNTNKGLVYDAVVECSVVPEQDYNFSISLHGNTVNVLLDGQSTLGYSFNSLLTDGNLGLFSINGLTSFDSLLIKTQI